MVQNILLISAIFQWLLLGFLVVFVVATMQLVGRRGKASENSLQIQNLKGINIGEELVTDVSANRTLTIQELLSGRPMLLLVTDPGCQECLMTFRQLASDGLLPTETLVAVRGNNEVAELFARTEAIGQTVILEHRGLGLTSYKPPFATVLDRSGTYVASAPLSSDGRIDFMLGVLNAEKGFASPGEFELRRI